MEKTLIIFKPDSLAQRCVGRVLTRFEAAGLNLCASKMLHLSESVLREHYSHLLHLEHFPKILAFMRERPVLICVFAGEEAIKRIREMLGPTDSTVAPKDSIRGELGTDKMRNICHASDSTESAEVEIKRFFHPTEVLEVNLCLS